MLGTVAATSIITKLKHHSWGDLGTCLPLGRLRVMILSVSGPKDCEERKREGREGVRERREEGEREEEEGKKKEGERGGGGVRERDEGEGTLQG